MIELIALIATMLACLGAEAFFASAELAFLSVNRARILRLAKENDLGATLAKNLLVRPEQLFSTTVVGTTLAINLSTTLATLYLIRQFGYSAEWLNLFVLSPIIVIFGEFIPKMVGRTYADRLALRFSKPLLLSSFVLYPFTRLFTLYSRVLNRLFGDNPKRTLYMSREEIRAAIPASRGSDVTSSERALIRRILDSSSRTAKEMLRPLIDVVGIEENEPLSEAVRLLAESEHSRLPVYQERIDRIVGVIQGFDCLSAPDLSQPVKTLMQPAFYVPESKPLDELLRELRTRPMAIAVNEFGGAEGILTLEDVIEEIVGEIEDEYDEPPSLYHRLGDNSFIVNARMEVDELRDTLKIPVPQDEDYQTLAGFLLKRMQKIPKKWDSVTVDNVEYIVQSATDRSIEEVYIIVHGDKS